jgi:hypothetical protein
MSGRLTFAAALALALASGAALACPGKTTATEGSRQQGSGSPTAETRG